jgi:hypothetical protein
MSGLDIHYDLGEGHPLLGRRMPDLDLVTANGPLRVFTLLHDARPVLLNLGEPGGFDITPWADRVQLIDAEYGGRRQHKHGSPEALVSDGGAVFKAKDALRIYATFQITKERIEKRQAWQSYIETAFSIQRRMADYAFAAATSWPELRAIHERWFADYNYQDHWAHRQRTDGCHSPAEVLGWVHGLYHTEEEIERAFRHRAGRVVNRSGYVRYRHRRVYAERGLIGQPATMWLCGETLTVEHQDEPLSQFAVEFEPDHYHLARVTDPRLFETRFVSPQPFLWYLGDVEWHLVRKAAPYQRRPKPAVAGVQLALFSADVWRRALQGDQSHRHRQSCRGKQDGSVTDVLARSVLRNVDI